MHANKCFVYQSHKKKKSSRGLNIYPVDTSNNYFAFKHPIKPLE